jgi:ribosome biogenesis GTPase A
MLNEVSILRHLTTTRFMKQSSGPKIIESTSRILNPTTYVATNKSAIVGRPNVGKSSIFIGSPVSDWRLSMTVAASLAIA